MSIHANLEGGRGSWVADLDPICTPLSSNPKVSPGQLVCSYSRMTISSHLCVCVCRGLSHEGGTGLAEPGDTLGMVVSRQVSLLAWLSSQF